MGNTRTEKISPSLFTLPFESHLYEARFLDIKISDVLNIIFPNDELPRLG